MIGLVQGVCVRAYLEAELKTDVIGLMIYSSTQQDVGEEEVVVDRAFSDVEDAAGRGFSRRVCFLPRLAPDRLDHNVETEGRTTLGTCEPQARLVSPSESGISWDILNAVVGDLRVGLSIHCCRGSDTPAGRGEVSSPGDLCSPRPSLVLV